MKKWLLTGLVLSQLVPVGAVFAQEEKDNTVHLTPDELVFGDPAQFEEVKVELVYPDSYHEDNELVQSMKKFIKENPTVGKNGAVSFSYTGNYLKSDKALSGIFYIVNKTGKELSNFNLKVTMKVKGETILDGLNIEYRAEDMMVLPDKSVIPIALPMDVDKADLLSKIESYEDLDIQFDFEEVDA